MANASTDDLQAKIREARERRNRLEESGEENMLGDPLALPGHLVKKCREAKLHLCWVNDDPHGNVASFEERGYFVVNEQGVNTKRFAGISRSGEAYHTVLMALPQDLYDADRAKELSQLDEITAEIRQGRVADKKTGRLLTEGELKATTGKTLITRETFKPE